MVRANKIAILLDDDEYDELKKRAEEAHLPLAAYCRSYLLTEQKALAYIPSAPRDIDIRRLKKPPPAPDPYEAEKQKTHAIFRADVQDELFEKVASGKPLEPIPDKVLDEIKKYKKEREHIVNKAMKEIRKKNIKAGIFDGV